MPASVRDILLVIRTKEDASKAINNIAGSMRRASAQADAASARAQSAMLRSQAAQMKLAGATNAQVAAVRNQAKAYDAQASSIEKANKKAGNLGHSMENVGRVTQLTGAAMVVAGAATLAGLKQAVDVASDWDKQVRLTYTQVDKRFKPSLQELSDIGLRVSRDIAVPFEKVQDALFDVFSSTEANLPQAENLLRSFAKAAVAGQTDIQTASRATIGLMNAYRIPFKDVNKVLDVQFQLVQEGVGTYEEWAQRIGLVTPSAVRAGQSIETMAAALSTATRLGTSAARAGTAVARAFDAISNPKTEIALKEIGVSVRDAKGNMRPLVDIMTEWRAQLEKLPKADRIKSILDTLKGAGSTIEARRFLQNILLTKGGLELFQDQIHEFATDKGAFEAAYSEMAGAIASKSQILHNSWMQLKLAIGNALLPAFTQIVGVIQKVMDWFNRLPKGTQDAVAKFLLWGSVLGIVAGVITAIIGTIIAFAGAIAMAGTALAPMLGTLAGVAAVGAVVIAAIMAIGAALYYAYQTSAPFRALVADIWSYLQSIGAAAMEMGRATYQAFQTTMMPALKAVWAVIQAQVIPAVREMVNWVKANMIPAARDAYMIFLNQVRPALANVAGVIKSDVVPAISNLVQWWKQNKDAILPVVTKLMEFMKAGAMVSGFIIGVLVTSIATSIKIFTTLVTVVLGVIQWFRNLYTTIVTTIGQATIAVMNGVSSIKGAFAGAGAWLVGAGRDVIMGLVNGIRGAIGEAAAAAADVAAAAINAAKSALHIKSPSRVFRDIGANVVRGFQQGIVGNRKKIIDTMFALSRDIKRSIGAADIKAAAKRKMLTSWSKKLSTAQNKLLALEGKRSKLQTQVAAQTKTLNDLLKKRADLTDKIKESLASVTDLTTLEAKQQKTPATMLKGLQARLQALKEFRANLLSLSKRGLDTETIADLAGKGVDAAGGIVKTLAGASTQELRDISKTQEEIRKLAASTATDISGQLYNAGIAAAQGLIKGLNSQIGAITKQMTTIANALVAAIKKQLGIRSPSTVFAGIGVNTAQGYINGYIQNMNSAKSRLSQATMFNPFGPSTMQLNPYNQMPMNAGVTKIFHQDIDIHTQEIDPRKTAAELGWELQGRM